MITYKKRYFKVIHGYGTEDYIEIDTVQDLEKAIFAMRTGSTVRLGDNIIKGTEIKMIKEDWNRTMGYARGYKLEPEDWTEIESRGVRKLYSGYIHEVGNTVQELTSSGRVKLIGTDRKELPEITKQLDK